MLRHTGMLGIVHEMTAQPPRAYLADFDIDGSGLKPAHRSWLIDKIVAPVKAQKTTFWKLYIDGLASRPGSQRHNRDLSERRAKAVSAFLLSQLFGSRVSFDETWHGEVPAKLAHHPEHKENADDRAVIVCLQVMDVPPPPPMERPHPAPRPNKNFRIRLVGAYGGSRNLPKLPLSFAAENVYFQIHDLDEGTTAFYVYGGYGVSYGPPIPKLPSSVGVTYAGKWNNFTVKAPHRVDEFDGAARFFQAAVNMGTAYSANTFCFGGFRSITHFLVEIKGFRTGQGIALPSVTETVGKMHAKTKAAPFADDTP